MEALEFTLNEPATEIYMRLWSNKVEVRYFMLLSDNI